MACTVAPSVVREMALESGFDLVGFAPAGPGEHGARFARWLEAGRAGEMDYLHRNRERILHPENWLPGVRSSINLAFDYGTPPTTLLRGGRVARYAVDVAVHTWFGELKARVPTGR